MTLQTRVIVRILQASVPAYANLPIHVDDVSKHASWLQAFQSQLRDLGILTQVSEWNRVVRLTFTVEVDANLPYFEDGYGMLDLFMESFEVCFTGGILHLQQSFCTQGSVPVYDAQQIANVAHAIQARLQQQVNRRQKSAKIRELKYKFISARIDELQKQYRFWMRLERHRTFAWLVVEFGDVELCAEIRYEAVMPCMKHIENLLTRFHENPPKLKKPLFIRWDTAHGHRWWTMDPPRNRLFGEPLWT